MRIVFIICCCLTTIISYGQNPEGKLSVVSGGVACRGCDTTIMKGPLMVISNSIDQYGQGDTIHLDEVSKWEIYDQYGNRIRTGTSKDIEMRGLEAGGYFLVHGDITVEIAVFNDEHRNR